MRLLYISLTANPESGLSPLEAVLKIDGTFGIQASSISYRGPGGVEWLSSSVDEYRVRLTAEGIHTFTANVIGPDGNIYQDTIAIVVLNRTELDALLKSKWEGMKNALIAGDIEGAISFFEQGSQDTYRKQFTALRPILNSIANDMGQINLVRIEDNSAEYEIITTRNGVTYSLHLLFVKDKDGLWRIKVF